MRVQMKLSTDKLINLISLELLRCITYIICALPLFWGLKKLFIGNGNIFLVFFCAFPLFGAIIWWSNEGTKEALKKELLKEKLKFAQQPKEPKKQSFHFDK